MMSDQSDRAGKAEVVRTNQSLSGIAEVQMWQSSSGDADLVDMGVVFWAHRWLMLVVFLVFLVLTAIAATLKPTVYEYTTTLQLGSVILANGNIAPLMSSRSVMQALQDIYLPAAMSEYGTDTLHKRLLSQLPVITVTGDPGGGNVAMKCKSKPLLGAACAAVEEAAANNFIRGNSQFAVSAQNQLDSLQVQEKVLHTQLDKLDESAALDQQQARVLSQQIESMQQAELSSAKNSGSEQAVLPNMILSNQVQRAMDSLSKIRENLNVGIPQQRAVLSQQFLDNLHAQQVQQQTIMLAQFRILNPGMRSLQPTGLTRAAIVAIGIVLSIIIGLLSALIASYVGRVRRRLALQTGN